MKVQYHLKRAMAFFMGLLLLCSPFSVFAAEESANEEPVIEEEAAVEEERLEPDAYFEPIQTDSTEGWPAGPPVWAESAVVMDLDSNTILYGKNMDAIRYPASITKILTALLVIENTSPCERVVFSENAIFGIEPGSSHIGIRVGEILSIEECLHGIMLQSANEVCMAVAEHIAGSVEAFVDMMNQRAAQLGCVNTHFTNPHGLPDEDHYTTAHDMALIAAAAYSNPQFRELTRTTDYTIPFTNMTGEKRWLVNHHKMLPDGKYEYEGCTGGKTGFTDAALNTLVTFAEKNGRKLVCVSLRTNGPMIYQDTASMLDYGFDNFQNITLFCKEDQPDFPIQYFGPAGNFNSVRPDTTITIPAGASMEDVETVCSGKNHVLSRQYLYHGYMVGQESIPEDTMIDFVSREPEHLTEDLIATCPETSSCEHSEENHGNWIIPVLVLVLLLLIIMEIIIAVRRHLKKKRRKKEKELRERRKKILSEKKDVRN